MDVRNPCSDYIQSFLNAVKKKNLLLTINNSGDPAHSADKDQESALQVSIGRREIQQNYSSAIQFNQLGHHDQGKPIINFFNNKKEDGFWRDGEHYRFRGGDRDASI